MKMIKTLFFSVILSLSLGSFSAKAAECGKVQVAEMTWTSAAVLAYFDALVLREGFGCDTEVVAGDTMPTSTSTQLCLWIVCVDACRRSVRG